MIEHIESLSYYPMSFFDGTCFKNFHYNNTVEPKEIILSKVVTAAIVAGIITLLLSVKLVPLVILIVGGAIFIHQTAIGKNPPSPEFTEYVLNDVKNPQKPKISVTTEQKTTKNVSMQNKSVQTDRPTKVDMSTQTEPYKIQV